MLEIRILPLFYKDLEETLDYISTTLEAPQAARTLAKEVWKSINDLKDFPLAHRRYQPPKPLPFEFRVLTVKNYYVFYTVQDFIQIHHLFYKNRDFTRLIR